MSSIELNASNLNLVYIDGPQKTEALSDVTISIKPSEFVVIIGPSGCGKTSLIRVLSGLIRPTKGSVFLGIHPVDQPSQEIGVIFQQNTVFPWFTIGGNIEFALRNQIRNRDTRKKRSLELLSLVGLKEFAASWPYTLSGGMAQRLTLARAIATQPKVLLLDEPFSALDAISRSEMHTVLLDIWRERGISILLVTHDLDEAVTLGDRVHIMSHRPGRILEDVIVDLPRPRIQNGIRSSGFDVVHNKIALRAVDLYRAPQAL